MSIAMRSRFERAFESILWNSRFVVVLAVLGGLALWLTHASETRGSDRAWQGQAGEAESRPSPRPLTASN
jgi:hypothetical protein